MDYSSFMDTYQQTSSGSGGSFGGSVISMLLSIATIVAAWFLFEKAGEAGWQSIIPFYSIWVMFRIVYGAGWKCLLLLVPILNIAVLIMFPFRLAKAYNGGLPMGLGCLFLPQVFQCILAFGPFTYSGPCYSFL